MFTVVIHYWMADTTQFITDAIGVNDIMAGLKMTAVSAIEILAMRGD